MNLEDKYQCEYKKWFSLRYPKVLMWHTPNGGSRNKIEADKFKRMGVLAGVPDIFIPLAKNGYNGFFIELKTESGKATASQKEVMALLKQNGYKVTTCFGLESAIKETEEYISKANDDDAL